MKNIVRITAIAAGIAVLGSACTPQEIVNWHRANNAANAVVTVEKGVDRVPTGMIPGDQLNVIVPDSDADRCTSWLGRGESIGDGRTVCWGVNVPIAQDWINQHALVPVASPAGPAVQAVSRWSAVDGDTIDTEHGRVRILGYDTPERGECGYDEARLTLNHYLSEGAVTLSADNGDNTDRYGRLLRHVLVNGDPVGLMMIQAGKANARYDSLDGYPRHRYQDQYRAADGTDTFSCAAPAPAPTPAPAPAPGASSEPWNMPGPDLDCSDIRRKVRVLPPDYHRLDRDGDGWGCESYG